MFRGSILPARLSNLNTARVCREPYRTSVERKGMEGSWNGLWVQSES